MVNLKVVLILEKDLHKIFGSVFYYFVKLLHYAS